MDFGEALQALKQQKRVSREGWNGKGMWLILIPPGSVTLPNCDIEFPAAPYIAMMAADGRFVPWVTSQADVLATDWIVAAPVLRNREQKPSN